MDVVRATVALALACAVCAQQVGQRRGQITVVQTSELSGPLAENNGPACDPDACILALQPLLQRTLQQDDPQATVQFNRKTMLVVLSQLPATHDVAQRAFAAVRSGSLEVRVQCTVFALPN